tara:strand:- start:50 stop:457 length:408 start_codon:yes stop_codon:yes gene_type:complete
MAALCEQINKHERLINQNENDISITDLKICIFESAGHKETKQYKQLIEEKRYNELHNIHSKYMIRLFKSYQENIPQNPDKFEKTLKVLIGLIKTNAQDIEDCMRQLVEYGYYNEQEYKTHMERFMAEIDAWSRFF